MGLFTQDCPLLWVIEPQDDLRERLTAHFEQRGFRVRSFLSPADALEALAQTRRLPASIVLDAALRGADGFARAKHMVPAARDVQVILLSKLPDVQERAMPEESNELEGVVRACGEARTRPS